MREQFHTKEGEEQKLVVSDTADSAKNRIEDCPQQDVEEKKEQPKEPSIDSTTSDEIGRQPEKQSSSTSGSAESQTQSLQPPSDVYWRGAEPHALKRHRLIVRSMVGILCVLGIAMGICIYDDGLVNREIDRGLGLLVDKRWESARDVLKPIDKTKVSRRFSRGDFEKAALIMYPNDERFINLGRDLHSKGQLQEAETAYRNALAFQYRDFDTQMQKGYAVTSPPTPIFRLATVLKEQHKTREAVQLLKLAKAMYCVDYDTTQLAKSLGVDIPTAMTEESAKNQEYLNQLKENWIASARLNNEGSDIYGHAQDRRKVFELISKQIDEFPDFAPAYLVRAEFNFLADPEAAMVDLNHVLDLYPGLPQALELRAKLYLQQGIQDQSKELLALQDYDEALKTLPTAGSLLLAKSETLDRMLRFRESAATLDRALQLHPADVLIRERMASALIRAGDKAEALKQLRLAAVLLDLKRQIGLIHRDDRLATVNIAALMFHLNKPNEALAMLDKEYLVKDLAAIDLKKKINDQAKN